MTIQRWEMIGSDIYPHGTQDNDADDGAWVAHIDYLPVEQERDRLREQNRVMLGLLKRVNKTIHAHDKLLYNGDLAIDIQVLLDAQASEPAPARDPLFEEAKERLALNPDATIEALAIYLSIDRPRAEKLMAAVREGAEGNDEIVDNREAKGFGKGL